MPLGIGGKTEQQALAELSDMTTDAIPISESEYRTRLSRLQDLMVDQGVDYVYLHGGTNLYYFTGLSWHPSERMVAALVPAKADIAYVAPRFELDTIKDFWLLKGDVHCWEEHESPYDLVAKLVSGSDTANSILLDEVTPYFIVAGLQASLPEANFGHAQPLTQACRAIKSETEIALIRRAHEMTILVHQAAASILKPGISTLEVEDFINRAHQRVGAAGSSFCIVLFGVASSFPHGVKDPQILKEDDWVLIDTGCLLQNYHSDITRSFAFGASNQEQVDAWNLEKAAQIAAFDAAKIGTACEVADAAARSVLEAAGYGPDYALPGLPHRTGHGCGLDIHEGPNLVRGEKTVFQPGMVFSSEPMLVLPDKFGVRLEDHFYMDSTGPVWLTEPAKSFDDPFGLA